MKGRCVSTGCRCSFSLLPSKQRLVHQPIDVVVTVASEESSMEPSVVFLLISFKEILSAPPLCP